MAVFFTGVGLAALQLSPSFAASRSIGASRLRPRCAVACMLRPDEPLFMALPPAADRDIAAEASVAASLFRPSSVPLFTPVNEEVDKPEQRRLVLLTRAGGDDLYQQLVCEVVANITSGKRAGTTWAKPLALRSSSNATMNEAAYRFDPCIGWADHSGVPSTVHVFSQLAPTIFVPTETVEPVPSALALAVRTMAEAHGDAEALSLEAGASPFSSSRESAMLHAFVRTRFREPKA